MAQDVSIDHGVHKQATGHMTVNVVPALRKVANDMELSVHAVGAGWKGTAKASFDKFHTNLQAALDDLHKSLNGITEALGQSNQHLGTTDISNADVISHAGNGLQSVSYTNL